MSDLLPIRLHNSTIQIASNQFDLLQVDPLTASNEFESANDYTRFVFCKLVNSFKNDLVYYQIPVGFKVYVGWPITLSEPPAEQPQPYGNLILYLNAEDASQNGFIYEYTFTQPCELLALDRVSNLTIISEKAYQEGQYDVFDALEDHFELIGEPNTDKVSIHYNDLSDPSSRFVIHEYLCQQGLAGYAYRPLSASQSTGALVLCSAHQYLSQGYYSAYNDSFVVSVQKI